MQRTTALIRELRKTIGRNIYRQRGRRGMTLRKLAKRSGVREEMLDYYEIGRDELGLDDLVRISLALDVRIEDLLFPGK